jgi:hypothetical protein
MQAALRLKARVLPGKRVEFASPELPEGEEVELIVMLPETARTGSESGQGVWDFIQSLPAGPRSAATWDELERGFQAERKAWGS